MPRAFSLKQVSGIARLIITATLALAILSGIAPFTASSSSQTQFCTMSCCVGKPPHVAGSCGMSFSGKSSATHDASCGALDVVSEKASGHDDMMLMDDAPANDKGATSADHCFVSTHQTSPSQSSHPSPQQPASVASLILNAPCSPECGAGAGSFAQTRPSRDQAAMAHAVRPRPPTLASRAGRFDAPTFISAERRRQSRPRAPPFC